MKSLFGEDESAAALFTCAMLAYVIAGDAAISRRRRLKEAIVAFSPSLRKTFHVTELTTSALVAAEFIRRGCIVAFPTETVYGLGADVFDANAIARVFEAKKRPADNPLIAHVASRGQISQLTGHLSPSAEKLIEQFFPGPLTIVVKKAPLVPLIATAGLDTIGVRMPADPLAIKFLSACDRPVVAPSANLSGRPSPTTWQAVFEDLDGRIDCILQGSSTEIGLESTVVDCARDVPVVLRSGAISLEQLQVVVPETSRLAAEAETVEFRSPGLRHKHYSPAAKVVIVAGPDDVSPGSRSAYIGLGRPTVDLEKVLVCETIEDYARSLFAFFRECDRAGIAIINCQAVAESGIGVALMDRLRRAATG